MKGRLAFTLAWAAICLVLATCSAPLGKSAALLRLDLALPTVQPALSRYAAGRAIPADLDGIYVELVDNAGIAFQERVTAQPGSLLSLELSVPAGEFDLHVFALRGDLIADIALQNGLTILAGASQSLYLAMSELTRNEPANLAYLGPGNPEPQAVYRQLGQIPAAFQTYLASGTVRLFGKLNNLPTSLTDSTVDWTASLNLYAGRFQLPTL